MDTFITSFTGLQSLSTWKRELTTFSEEKNKELIEKIHTDAIKSFGYTASYLLVTIIVVIAVKSIL